MNIEDVFTTIQLAPGELPEFPTSLLENDTPVCIYYQLGRIIITHDSDFIYLPTKKISSVDERRSIMLKLLELAAKLSYEEKPTTLASNVTIYKEYHIDTNGLIHIIDDEDKEGFAILDIKAVKYSK